MLEILHLKNVGPAPEMKMDLAPRLSLITGDNGLGKSLLLDSAWWALTRTWPLTWGGKGIVPDNEGAAIDWVERRGDISLASKSEYDFAASRWTRTEGSSASLRTADLERSRQKGAIVLYARVDGGVSVHDPLRVGEDFRLPFGRDAWDVSNAFQFREAEIWDGLDLRAGDKASRACEGLVRDVVRWAVEPDNAEFERLSQLVDELAGDEHFRLARKVGRVYVDDPRDFPFVLGPAGPLPVAHAPAGLRRILGLAYLVVWAWREHKIAANLKKLPVSTSLVLLFDEVEGHLHPKWQRTILPSLLRALGKDLRLQVLATTHSPMVLASIEPVFDVLSDKLFLLELEDRVVTLRETPWAKQGDVIHWLVSDTFGLRQGRSVEAETAIEAANAWMRGDTAALPPGLSTKEAIHTELKRVLAGHDPFWPRWIMSYESTGGRP